MNQLQGSNQNAHLAQIEQKRQALGMLLQREQALLHSLGMEELESSLIKAKKPLQTDEFKILFIGELSRGKSTLLNAFLRKEILQASTIPCSVINEVKWGESPKALVYDGADVAKEIAVDQLLEYGTAASLGEPRKKVELFWPLELCRDRVELIEYPSLSTGSTMTDYLASVDAVVLVLSCQALLSSSEAKAIQTKVLPAGHEDLFFVCNRLDGIRHNERDRIIQHGLSQLRPYTKSDEPRIFFVSAVEALEGYLEDEPKRVEQSGLPQLEAALGAFLANDRERVKVQRAITQAKAVIPKAIRIIEERASQTLREPTSSQKQARHLDKGIQQLQESREYLVAQIGRFSQITQELIRDTVINFLREIASQVESWVAAYEISEGAKISTAFSEDDAQKLSIEIANFVSNRVEQKWTSWQNGQLMSLMAQRTERLKQELNAESEAFVRQLNSLHLDMTDPHATFKVDIDVAKFRGTTRLVDSQSTHIPDVTIVSSSDLAKILGLAIAAGMVVGWFSPFLGLPASIGTALFMGHHSVDSTVQQIKQQVGESFRSALWSQSEEQANKVASAVAKNLAEIQQAYDKKMEQVIKNVKAKVTLIKAETEKGQEATNQAMNKLALARQELEAIEKELANLNPLT